LIRSNDSWWTLIRSRHNIVGFINVWKNVNFDKNRSFSLLSHTSPLDRFWKLTKIANVCLTHGNHVSYNKRCRENFGRCSTHSKELGQERNSLRVPKSDKQLPCVPEGSNRSFFAAYWKLKKPAERPKDRYIACVEKNKNSTASRRGIFVLCAAHYKPNSVHIPPNFLKNLKEYDMAIYLGPRLLSDSSPRLVTSN